jgi:hypothetical protein
MATCPFHLRKLPVGLASSEELVADAVRDDLDVGATIAPEQIVRDLGTGGDDATGPP